MPDDYDYQERAAIIEFEAGLSRLDAEAAARCYSARQNHLAAPVPPDHAGAPGGQAAATVATPQPEGAAPADRRAHSDPPLRDDSCAEPPNRDLVDRSGKPGTPYAVAAARASPAYLAAKETLKAILTSKGATNHG